MVSSNNVRGKGIKQLLLHQAMSKIVEDCALWPWLGIESKRKNLNLPPANKLKADASE